MPPATPLNIAIVVVGLTAIVLNWMPTLDAAGTAYLSDAMAGNLVIYASARALNGIISVIQSIEVGVSLGAGVAISLGEVLDPLNDLIERFSSFILVVLAAIGLQKLILAASVSLVMKGLVTVAIIGGVMAALLAPTRFTWLKGLAGAIVLTRFIFILQVGVLAVADHTYFDERDAQARAALSLAQQELGELRSRYLAAAREDGIFSGAVDTVLRLVGDDESAGVADIAANAVVELMVILLVRTIILPLLFLWLLYLGTRYLLSNQWHPTG